MKRLRAFSFVATLVVAATIGTSIINAKVPDVYITYQTGGHTCWDAASPNEVAKGNYDWRSPVVFTKSADDTNALGFFGTGWGDWAINRDGSQVNCLKLNLFPSQTKTTNKEFVLCGQAAELKTSKSFFQSIFGGQSTNIQSIGSETCTDTISATSGNFLKLSTSNNGTIGAVRFRFKPAGFFGGSDTTARDLRISTQLQNENGTKGGVISTAWSNLGFQDAKVNQAGGNLNGIYFALETKNPTAACTQEQINQSPTIDLSDITYVTAVKSGITTCPAGRLFVGVDQQDHAGAVRIKCAVARNILRDIGQTEVGFTGEGTYKCQAGSILVGLVQDSEGREKAIRCQEAAAGAIDFALGNQVVGVHGRDGDRYEVNFSENKAGAWVPTAGIYNSSPNSSRGLKGYLVAPVAQTTCTPVADCTSVTTSKTMTVVPGGETFQIITNPGNITPTTGTSVAISKASKWANPISGTSWTSYKSTANQSGSGPAGGTQIAFTKTFVIEGAPQQSTLLVMADDLLNVKINGNQVFDHQNAGELLFTSPTSVTIPASVLNTGTNTIVFTVGQRNPDDNSAIGFDYSFSVNSVVTIPPSNPSCPTVPPTTNPPGNNPGTNNPGGTTNGGNNNGGTGTNEPPATCTFSASKTTIIKGVDTSTLSWSCSNGGATANITGLGSVSKSGTRVVSPTEDTTYTLTYGTVTKLVTIKVNTPNIQEQ